MHLKESKKYCATEQKLQVDMETPVPGQVGQVAYSSDKIPVPGPQCTWGFLPSSPDMAAVQMGCWGDWLTGSWQFQVVDKNGTANVC